MNANDLLDWIDHLSDEDREVEIVMSRKFFPDDDDLLIPFRIGRYMGHGEFTKDVYVMVVADIDEFEKVMNDEV